MVRVMETNPTRARPASVQRLLPVFFTPAMVARAASFSPSAAKPGPVVASWRARGLPMELLEPMPVTPDQLALAHDRRHVLEILGGRALNGFGDRSPEVAASLPYTTGAMLSAARHAVLHGGFAVAPCSGFHHAGYRQVEGFCTFNGLMVTACALKQERLVRRVGILDCDQHYGNGTEEIIEHLGARGWVRHFTAGAEHHRCNQAEGFLARLPEIATMMADCDLVLYQAGADPHVDDPLGGWLTTAQLRRRDACVFSTFHDLGVPVAWNLAGGYQKAADGSIPKVLEIHDNTAFECVRAFGIAGRVVTISA
jgi:acetoin utilization deacetylase AcuC-like enzyme